MESLFNNTHAYIRFFVTNCITCGAIGTNCSSFFVYCFEPTHFCKTVTVMCLITGFHCVSVFYRVLRVISKRHLFSQNFSFIFCPRFKTFRFTYWPLFSDKFDSFGLSISLEFRFLALSSIPTSLPEGEAQLPRVLPLEDPSLHEEFFGVRIIGDFGEPFDSL